MKKDRKVFYFGGKKSAAVFRTLFLLIAVISFTVLLTACCSTQNEGAIMVASNSVNSDGEELAAPSAVKLDLSSDKRKIKLSWSKAENATGYEVYMSKDGSGYDHLVSTNQLEYETQELTPGDTYYFRIKPYNSRAGCKTVYGESTDKSVTCVESQQIDGYDVGDTYVHIDIDKQTLWFYKNNKLIVETPVVTGTAGACDTPTGYFEVRTMAAPAHLVGPTWDVTTEYWVGINLSNDIGMHDSPWRDTGYGGDIYTYSGSNGCINTPLDAMKKIYENITIGTPVVISGSVQSYYSAGDNGYELETTPDTIIATDSQPSDYDDPDGDTSDYSPDYTSSDSDGNYDYDSSTDYYSSDTPEEYGY